jgi:hypothetical protein
MERTKKGQWSSHGKTGPVFRFAGPRNNGDLQIRELDTCTCTCTLSAMMKLPVRRHALISAASAPTLSYPTYSIRNTRYNECSIMNIQRVSTIFRASAKRFTRVLAFDLGRSSKAIYVSIIDFGLSKALSLYRRLLVGGMLPGRMLFDTSLYSHTITRRPCQYVVVAMPFTPFIRTTFAILSLSSIPYVF